jgi:hypothetical protein
MKRAIGRNIIFLFAILFMAACTVCHEEVRDFWPGTQNLRYEYCTDNMGLPHGISTDWYANGNVRASINYSHGILDGEFFMYHENGTVYVRAMYEVGALMEVFEYKTSDGTPLQINIHGGSGEYLEYDDKGSPLGKCRVKNGYFDGDYLILVRGEEKLLQRYKASDKAGIYW